MQPLGRIFGVIYAALVCSLEGAQLRREFGVPRPSRQGRLVQRNQQAGGVRAAGVHCHKCADRRVLSVDPGGVAVALGRTLGKAAQQPRREPIGQDERPAHPQANGRACGVGGQLAHVMQQGGGGKVGGGEVVVHRLRQLGQPVQHVEAVALGVDGQCSEEGEGGGRQQAAGMREFGGRDTRRGATQELGQSIARPLRRWRRDCILLHSRLMVPCGVHCRIAAFAIWLLDIIEITHCQPANCHLTPGPSPCSLPRPHGVARGRRGEKNATPWLIAENHQPPLSRTRRNCQVRRLKQPLQKPQARKRRSAKWAGQRGLPAPTGQNSWVRESPAGR